MKLSWKALALAPLAAPLIFGLLACLGMKNPLGAFLFFFLLGSPFCYGATIFMFLPALFCLSMFTKLRFYKVFLLGTFLGAAVFFPVAWVMYKSSGPDSGPPEGTYFAFLSRSWGDFVTWFFPIGGLITATAYWLLAKKPGCASTQLPGEAALLPRSL